MKTRMIQFCGTAIVTALVLTSCATTTLSYVWRDENYRGHLDKVLVIGVGEKPAMRRIFERDFVHQLKGQNVDAVASYQLFPSAEMLEKDRVIAKMTELGMETVILTKLAAKRTIQTKAEGWFEYYGRHETIYEDEVVTLETNIYDLETERPVWSAATETFLMEGVNINRQVTKFVKGMIRRLSDDGLIR